MKVAKCDKVCSIAGSNPTGPQQQSRRNFLGTTESGCACHGPIQQGKLQFQGQAILCMNHSRQTHCGTVSSRQAFKDCPCPLCAAQAGSKGPDSVNTHALGYTKHPYNSPLACSKDSQSQRNCNCPKVWYEVPPQAGSPQLACCDKFVVQGSQATAFVCQNFACQAPTNDPEKLQSLLQSPSQPSMQDDPVKDTLKL